MRSEPGKGSVTANNRWNLPGTLWAGIVGYWRGGSAIEQHDFPVFRTIYDGVNAAADNLLTGNYGYDKVVAAARRNDPNGFLHELAVSSWCSCHYQLGGGPNLPAIFAALFSLGMVTSHAPGN